MHGEPFNSKGLRAWGVPVSISVVLLCKVKSDFFIFIIIAIILYSIILYGIILYTYIYYNNII